MNVALFHDINDFAGHVAALDALVKFSALYLVFICALVVPALWFWPGPAKDKAQRQRVAASTVLATAVALVIAMALGAIYFEARPFVGNPAVHQLISHSADNGFPSDHATVAFAIATVVFWWRRPLGLILVALALLVAFARVYVGVHWPDQVLAGAALGIIVGSLAIWTVPLWIGPQRILNRIFPEWMVAQP